MSARNKFIRIRESKGYKHQPTYLLLPRHRAPAVAAQLQGIPLWMPGVVVSGCHRPGNLRQHHARGGPEQLLDVPVVPSIRVYAMVKEHPNDVKVAMVRGQL